MSCNMRISTLCKPCTRDHKHVVVQGQLTKGSAAYTPFLAEAIAELFAKHLRVEKELRKQQRISSQGLESVFVNEIAKRSRWEVSSVWQWKGKSHINVLERASVFQALKKAARRGGGRVSVLLDSHAAARAIAKGRSSARALIPLLRKLMAISFAFHVLLSVHFLPTRLNIAEDPRRDVSLREPSAGVSWLEEMNEDEVFKTAELPTLKRWASNWVSLVLGLFVKNHSSFASISLPYCRQLSSLPPAQLFRVSWRGSWCGFCL